jgi:hypothetical protein
MPYFEKTNKLSKVFIGLFGFFLMLTVAAFLISDFHELIYYNFTNNILGTICTIVFFMLSIFSLILGITLRYIAEDAENELASLAKQIRE